jgi:hypothetical protein
MATVVESVIYGPVVYSRLVLPCDLFPAWGGCGLIVPRSLSTYGCLWVMKLWLVECDINVHINVLLVPSVCYSSCWCTHETEQRPNPMTVKQVILGFLRYFPACSNVFVFVEAILHIHNLIAASVLFQKLLNLLYLNRRPPLPISLYMQALHISKETAGHVIRQGASPCSNFFW